MTETTERTAGTALEQQVAPGALALAQGQKSWTVIDLADRLAGPEPVLPKTAPRPRPAKVMELTTALRKALRAIPDVFARVQPTESRKLEASELKALTDEQVAINQVTKPLGDRSKVISEIVRHHMDHYGAGAGLVDENTLRIAEGIAKGHYLFAREQDPFEVAVEGYDDAWQQRFVKGSVTVNGSLAAQLEADGRITHDEYLRITRTSRSYDEAKMAEFIRKNPERGLQILAAMTSRSAPSASLYPPKK